MGTVQEDFYGKVKEGLHGKCAAGTLVGTFHKFMGKVQEEHLWDQRKRNIHGNRARGLSWGKARRNFMGTVH
jgi:hypothetical protein